MRRETHFSKMTEMIWVLVDAYLNLHYEKNKKKTPKFQKQKYYFLQLVCFSELTFVEPQSPAHHRIEDVAASGISCCERFRMGGEEV